MSTLPRLFRLLPKAARLRLAGALDRAVPERFRLPYVHMLLRMQHGLEEEMQWLPRFIKHDGVAIDVGANIGLYSYRLSKLCRRVEAFEPNLECLSVLQHYRAPNVRTHGVALSSETGTLTLHIPVVDGRKQDGLGSATPLSGADIVSIEVPKRRLDDYDFRDVCFIKIDVEGHEIEVLAGAERTIRLHHPVLLIEVEERHQQRGMQAVFSAVADYGYQGLFLFEGALHPLALFRYEFHQRGYLEGRQRLKYVNNFIFLRPNQVARLPCG